MKPKHFILTLLALFACINAYAEDYVVGQKFTVTEGMKITLTTGGTFWTSMQCEVTSAKPNGVYEVKIYRDSSVGQCKGKQIEIPQVVYYNGTSFIVTSIGKDLGLFTPGTAGAIEDYLQKVILPPTIEVIGEENTGCAFAGCEYLTEVSGANNLKKIGMTVFTGCSRLKSFPDLADFAFVEEIGSWAFCKIDSIHTLNLASIKKLGMAAFKWCKNLTSVELGEQLEDSIPYACFMGCRELKSIKIPEGVYAIGGKAFNGCEKLQSVEIPSTVNWIGLAAFNSTSEKRRFTVHATTPPTMVPNGYGNYYIDDNDTIYVPIGCSSAYLAAKGWQDGIIIEKDLRESQSIGLTTITPKTYGQANEYFEQKTKQGQVLNWTSSNTAVATFNGRIMSITGAGSATITATAAGNNQYLPFSQTFTLTVNKETLTVTANNETIQQGEALPSFSVSYSGFKYDDDESVLTNQPVITCNATSASSPGTYDINVSGASAKNYNISYVNGTLTITEATPITITANSYTRVYGDENPTFEFTVEGATLNGVPDISCAATPTSPVGTYPITITKGTVQNYNDTYVSGTLTITKAPLVITANDASMVQGSELPEFTASYSGFKNGESTDILTTQPTITTTATTDSPAGTYPITASGATAANYNITYVSGTMTVTEGPVVIEVTDISQLDNAIYIEPIEVISGSQVVLSVKMKNNVDVQTIQFDLYLPDGITIVANEDDELITASKERVRKFNYFESSIQANGALRLLAQATTTNVPAGDGEICTITVNIPEDMEEGDYPLVFKDMLMIERDNTSHSPSPNIVKTKLTVFSYVPGDANNDGTINGIDFNMIGNYILGYNQNNFNARAADINGDGSVNAIDFNIVGNIILYGNSSPSKAKKTSKAMEPA